MTRSRTHAGPPPQKAGVRPVSTPQDVHERQAERAAQVVARGGSVASWSFSAVPTSTARPVQRQGEGKPKSDEEKKKEALTKTGEALLETPTGKALKEKVLADPLVKSVKDAVGTTPGVIVTGAAVAGGVTALGAAGKPLPFQPPSIPLDRITPGLSAQVKLEGPVNAPTFVGLTLTYKEQGPKGKKASESEKIAADVARLRAEQEMFKPASQKAAERKQEEELIQAWIKQQSGLTIPLKGTPTEAPGEKKEEEPALVQRAPDTPSSTAPAHANVDDALSTSARPLNPAARRAMEARFGYDFSGVRVHDDARAAATAADIHAAAFTVGQDVVFGAGRYAPSTSQGRELLAHELAHTIQQRGAERKEPPVAPGSGLERRAEQAGRAAASGQQVAQSLGTSGVAVARSPDRPSSFDAYSDEQLEEEARIYRVALRRRPEYPEREKDVQHLDELTAEIARRQAISEAQAVLGPSVEEPEVDAPTPVPMSLARPRKGSLRPPASPPAPRRPSRPPSKFEPSGFTNEDIYGPWGEAEERIERETKPKDQPFEKRFYTARRHTELGDQSSWSEVWSVGRSEGLFSEDDRWAFDRMWEERIGKPARQEAKQHARAESIQRARAWEAQGEALRSPEGIIQPFAMGALGEAAAAAYWAYSAVTTGRDVARAYQTGDPSDIGQVVVDIGPGLLTHGVTGGGRAEPESGATPQAAKPPVPPELAKTAHPAELAKTAHPAELAKTAPPQALAKTAPPAALAKTATPGALEKTAPGTAEPAPGPRTQPSAPPAPRPAAPAAGRTPATRRVTATPVSAEEVAAALRANPDSVRRSWHPTWHEQMWLLDGGTGPPPRAFRAGRVIIVDPDYPL